LKVGYMEKKEIQFLRTRDYVLLGELGRGACGSTVLLRDEFLNQDFVCKKYSPLEGLDRQDLFKNFLREIKLLHELNHPNIVRVFSYHIYPDKLTGFIVMERVIGEDIASYLTNNPEQINEIFEQTIQGFCHLEFNKVLHRDIRDSNLMVSNNGVVKIIDLGFGKLIQQSIDFDKSISLNWWCDLPIEFASDVYDFKTEVYFVGKLFEKIILDLNINHFKYKSVLGQMCQRNPDARIARFSEVEAKIGSELFLEIEFTDDERSVYKFFADSISESLVTSERGKYVQDIDRLRVSLETAHRTVMLEDYIPDASLVLGNILTGAYKYNKSGFPVNALRDYLNLLKNTTSEKQRILLANLQNRLNSIPIYVRKPISAASGFDDMDEDIPF
jgi:eukaryotic-like serine/threonine-protein kinase